MKRLTHVAPLTKATPKIPVHEEVVSMDLKCLTTEQFKSFSKKLENSTIRFFHETKTAQIVIEDGKSSLTRYELDNLCECLESFDITTEALFLQYPQIFKI